MSPAHPPAPAGPETYLAGEVRHCVLEAEDLETQLHYAHAWLEHALRALYRRVCGRAAPLNGSCVDLARLEADLAARGLPVDPVVGEQLRVFERLWDSYLEHLDLRGYNERMSEMPYADRFGFARHLHADPQAREALLTIPAIRFREAFRDAYVWLRASADSARADPSADASG